MEPSLSCCADPARSFICPFTSFDLILLDVLSPSSSEKSGEGTGLVVDDPNIWQVIRSYMILVSLVEWYGIKTNKIISCTF